MLSFAQINEATGFADREPFATADEVREYFTAANLRKRGFLPADQKTLDDYANEVIVHGWHMAPFSATVLEGVNRVSYGGTLAEVWHWLEGFRSGEPCRLMRNLARMNVLPSAPVRDNVVCSGTVRHVMDWIETVLDEEKATDWT